MKQLTSWDSRSSDRLFGVVFTSSVLWQFSVILYNAFGLSPDESYYWEWSKRLDLAYYSKGPILAVLIWAGTAIFGDTPLGVRAPALLCATLCSLLLYLFLRSQFRPGTAVAGWLLYQSTLVFASTALLMTADSPMLLLWLSAICCGWLALGRSKDGLWYLAGFLAGVAGLGKLTALALLAGMIGFLAITPDLPGALPRRRVKLLVGVTVAGSLPLVPLVVWDYLHNWVNLFHNRSHMVGGGGVRFRPQFLVELIGGQLGLVGPVLFFLMLIAVCSACRVVFSTYRRRGGAQPVVDCSQLDLARLNFLLWTVLPVAAVCVVLGLTRRVYANWPYPIYLGGLLILLLLVERVLWVERGSTRFRERFDRMLVPAVVTNVLLVATAYLLLFGVTAGVPPERLPTKKLAGWEQIGVAVAAEVAQLEQELAELEELGELGRKVFVLTDSYEVAAEIAFYGKLPGRVFCANVDDRRMNQYDLWGGWQGLRGSSAVVVSSSPEKGELLKPGFQSFVTGVQVSELVIEYGGKELRKLYVYRGRGFDGNEPVSPTKH